jgi:hypothetical protein
MLLNLLMTSATHSAIQSQKIIHYFAKRYNIWKNKYFQQIAHAINYLNSAGKS